VVGNPQLLGSAAYGISASQSNSPSSPLLLNEGTTQYRSRLVEILQPGGHHE
jgi:hypothetical protein